MNITTSLPAVPSPASSAGVPSAVGATPDPRAALLEVVGRLGGQLLEGPQGPEFITGPASAATTGASASPVPESSASAVPLWPADWQTRGAICPLPDYGRLLVTGADATSFLQNQLTNDVATLAPDEARWTGYCTPKGRLLTTALNWREPDRILLAVARSQSEALRKRLSMFVLRAKAKVLDESSGFLAFGLLGAAIEPVLAGLGLARPSQAMAVTTAGALSAVGLAAIALPQQASPDDATGPDAAAVDIAASPHGATSEQMLERVMVWVPLDESGADANAATDSPAQSAIERLMSIVAVATAGGLPPRLLSTEAWRWTEVMAAVPRLFAGSSELFVPQMINFEAVGGVNFKKGCYPGQEIVARSQYLGKLKRRMFRGRLSPAPVPPSALPVPGQDVIPQAGGEPSGQVVLSAHGPDGGVDVLFESQIAAVEVGGVAIDGMPVHIEPLPYEVKR